jgi:hypothetical protein
MKSKWRQWRNIELAKKAASKAERKRHISVISSAGMAWHGGNNGMKNGMAWHQRGANGSMAAWHSINNGKSMKMAKWQRNNNNGSIEIIKRK